MHSLFYFQKKDSKERLPKIFETSETFNAHDLWELYNPRQPEKAFQLFGEDTEAQWCIHDAILSNEYLKMFIRSGNLHSKRSFYHHFFRALGQLTNEDSIAADGSLVAGLTMPEAYIPYRIKKREGQVFLPSKNTPLYWALCELRILFENIEENINEIQDDQLITQEF